MGIVLILLFGIALIVGPIAAEFAGNPLSSVSQFILMASGLAIALFAGVLLIITKLYQKTRAAAEKDARVALADGDKAVQMVPVDVKAQEVAVDQKRVETVLIPELEAREKHGRVAQDFELDKARIHAEMQVRIETARAAAEVYKKVDIKAFSTLDDVSKMTSRMMSGLGAAELANGLIDGLENDTVMKSLYGLEATIGAVANKLGLSRKDLEAAAAGTPVVEDRTVQEPEQPEEGQR